MQVRILALVAVYILAGCSSPTAPTPPPAPPPVSVVPPAPPTPPPSTPPATNPLLTDPRFNLAFYRQFVRDAHEQPTILQPLRRQTEAPRIYLRTIDDGGSAIDQVTLDATAAALIEVTGVLTGRFGIAGLERGTETREGVPGWITVRWSTQSGGTSCGRATIASDLLTLFPRAQNCRCSGGPAVKPLIVKHEMGHVLGFYHTDSVDDLMHRSGHTTCDLQPSAREQFHALIAYSQPIGSGDPR